MISKVDDVVGALKKASIAEAFLNIEIIYMENSSISSLFSLVSFSVYS